MRVLFVSSVGDLRGGAERSLLELARALQSRGQDVSLAVWTEGALADAFRELGTCHVLGSGDPASPLGGVTVRSRLLRPFRPVVRLAAWGRLWLRSTRGESRWLRKVIESVDPDVVHTNCDMSPVPVAAAVAAERGVGPGRRLPWAAHVRDHWRSWFHPRTYGALSRASTVVAPSRFLAQRFDGLGAPIRVIPNPIAGDRLRRVVSSAEREALRRGVGVEGPELFAVAVIGRLDAQKGVLDLVPAVEALEAAGDARIRFVLAGSGTPSVEDALRRGIEALGAARRMVLLGHREDVADWLPAMDALAVPSRGEPFGRMIVEGMHAGLPVVAYRDGAAPEIIDAGRSGLLVTPGDPVALAEALEGLAGDPSRAQRLGAGAREAAVRYEPRAVAESMEALYTTLRED